MADLLVFLSVTTWNLSVARCMYVPYRGTSASSSGKPRQTRSHVRSNHSRGYREQTHTNVSREGRSTSRFRGAETTD